MKNLKEIAARLGEIRAEMATIHDLDELTEEDEARFADLKAEAEGLDETRLALIERQEALDAVETAATDERNSTVPAAPVAIQKDVFDVRAGANDAELRARALSVVETAVGIEDEARENATRLIERMEGLDDEQENVQRGVVSRLVINTMAPAYRKAWVKLMAGQSDALNADERNAVARVEEFRAAFGLTESGYAVPALVDPTVILTSDGSINPVRSRARVESVTANSWKPVLSGGISAGWGAELAEVSDNTPTFSQPEITAHKAHAFAQGSIEAIEDWVGIAAELGREFADAKDQLEATAFWSGTGSGQPFGLKTELDGGSSEVAADTAETFTVADVYATVEAVPPRFRNGLVAMAELTTINAMRQFATASNYHAFLTELSEGQPRRLMGYALDEYSEMDPAGSIDPGATADNHILIAGDFKKYVIVDRVGLSVEYIPHLFNTANNLPDGRRGWYAHWRVGAESIVDGAFRVLNIATTL